MTSQPTTLYVRGGEQVQATVTVDWETGTTAYEIVGRRAYGVLTLCPDISLDDLDDPNSGSGGARVSGVDVGFAGPDDRFTVCGSQVTGLVFAGPPDRPYPDQPNPTQPWTCASRAARSLTATMVQALSEVGNMVVAHWYADPRWPDIVSARRRHLVRGYLDELGQRRQRLIDDFAASIAELDAEIGCWSHHLQGPDPEENCEAV